MAQLAIFAIVAVGSTLLENAFTSKPKQKPVDVGRFDDIRIQTSEENGFRPRIYGRVRLAGNLIDHSVTQEHVTQTPGSSGGKGGSSRSEPTPPQNHYSYTKTFALALCDGETSHCIQAWEDAEVIFSLPAVEFLGGTLYEAESGSNTLSGGASVVAQSDCSGGSKVTGIGNGGSLRFNGVTTPGAGTFRLRVRYMSNGVRQLKMSINGGAPQTIAFPSTGGVQGVLQIDIALLAGANTIRFYTDAGVSAPDIDAIRLLALTDTYAGDAGGGRGATGGVNPDLDFPVDQFNPSAFYNHVPLLDDKGMSETLLVSGGQAPFRFYRGTEDQLQDSALVALHGAENVPAYRGTTMVVFEDYQVKNGRLGNFTFLIEQGMHDLSEIIANEYSLVGLPTSRLDVSQLEGIWVEGLVIDHRAPSSEIIDALQTWYNFDIVDVDGKVRAVLRGGSPVVTIPEAELSAHEFGTERPLGPVRTVYANEAELPRQVDVAYLDPQKDYHTGVQPAQRSVGNTLEPQSISFPIVSDADTAQAVGLRFLYNKHLARTPREFELGPKYAHLIPTDVVNLALTGATHKVRLTNQQQALLGLGKYKALPEKQSIYTQVMGGYSGAGAESRPTEYPANTLLWMGDLPMLRLEDDELGYYVAVCPVGKGNWRGAYLRKEVFTDEYHLVTSFDRAAIIGRVSGSLPPVADPNVFDRTSELVIDLYYGTLESRSEEEIKERAVNLAVVGDGQNMEVIQFAQAVAESASDPFVARYRLTNLLRGRFQTDYAMSGHADGEPFVLLTDAVKFRHELPSFIQTTTNFKAVSVAQAERDAAPYSFYFTGNSKRDPAPTAATGERDSEGSLLIGFRRQSRAATGIVDYALDTPLLEEQELFLVKIMTAGGSFVLPNGKTRTMPVYVGTPMAAVLESDLTAGNKFDQVHASSLSTTNAGDTIRARSFQKIEGPGNFVEGKLFVENMGASAGLGLIPTDVAWKGLASLAQIPLYAVRTQSSPIGFAIYEYGVEVFGALGSEVGDNYAVPRVRFEFSGTEIRVKVDSNPVPLYIFNKSIPYPLHAFARVSDSDGASDVAVRDIYMKTIPHPYTIYSKAQQEEDFGSVQDPVRMQIVSVSALIGEGHPLDVTL